MQLEILEDEKEMPQQRGKPASYEAAFEIVGFGAWQYFLLLQCGWANASDAIEIMCVSFIVPSVRDSLHVSHAQLTGLMTVLFLGMMFGGYLWGSLADTYGRRRIIMISLIVNASFGALSAICKTYWLLLVFRFLSGIGVGGSLPVCFAYFSEFQQTKSRGAMISALATCWMAGNLMVAGLAWAVLPESHGFSTMSPYGEVWRLFVILCTIPSLSSSFFFYFMPESPIYLYRNGQMSESLEVLKTVYKWNIQRVTHSPFPVTKLLKDECTGTLPRHDEITLDDNVNEYHTLLESDYISTERKRRVRYKPRKSSNWVTSFFSSFKTECGIFCCQIQEMFSAEQGRLTTSIFATLLCVFVAFGGYGMAMWMPVMMEKTEQYHGSPCQVQHAPSHNKSHVDTGSNMYFDVFVGAAAQLPGNVLTIFVMDRMGAKLLSHISLFTTAISVLFFWLVSARWQVVFMQAVFNAFSTVVWNCLDVLIVEIYPTRIRSSATGFLTGVSRLGSISGNLLFGMFMDTNCGVPILSTFAVFTLAGFFSFKLPNTRNQVLQ